MNIYDIAKLSGVSIATVSRVVNGSSKVSESTRKKVLSVIDEQGYTPNVFAQGLGQGTMHTIGILVPSIADPYMSRAVSYLEGLLKEKGYGCILSCSGFESNQKHAHVQMLLSKKIDGMILVGSTYSGHDLGEHETQYIREAARQVPVLIINGQVEGEHVYSFVAMDEEAVYESVSSLIRRGRKRILFLTDSRSYSATQKLSGYEKALQDAGLPVLGNYKMFVKSDPHYVRDILLQYKNLSFDSVLATDDGIAVGAVKYAAAKGLEIPQDLCIIGYNNSDLSICSEPEITSIDGRCEQLCRKSVDTLLLLLEGKEVSNEVIRVPCRLIKRNTTDF